MKVHVKLTLDGMLRALRWRGHLMAEEVEQGYVAGGAPDDLLARPSVRRVRQGEENGYDRIGE